MGAKHSKQQQAIFQIMTTTNTNFDVDEIPNFAFETLAIHADSKMEYGGDIAPPLHMSATFRTGNGDQLTYARSGIHNY